MDHQFWEVVDMIEEGMGWHEEKIIDWMNVPNPLLGNVTPCKMIYLGRGAKLIEFVAQCLEQNVEEKRDNGGT